MSTGTHVDPRIADAVNRLVTTDEVRAALERPLSDEEREHTLALVRWFRRRYPSPQERLAYARRAYARWTRTVRP